MNVEFIEQEAWQKLAAQPADLHARIVQPESGTVVIGDNLASLQALPDSSIGLVYMDPPFNTGKTRVHRRIKTTKDAEADGAGARQGFAGAIYAVEELSKLQYADSFDDFLGFLLPRIQECWRVLDDTGTLYVHLDWREVHKVRVALDAMLGEEHFLNEIIWAYDFGGRPKRKWAAKHDTILVYVKNTKKYHFDDSHVDRIPYMAPGLVGPEKAARGKLPTDVWWHTIVGTSSKERTGYPTQKPIGVLRRIIAASAPAGLPILDPFGGSGTTGAAAAEQGFSFVLMDQNPEAIATMRGRFVDEEPAAAPKRKKK